MRSVWEENTEPIKINALNENKKTDVLIIGGGIAGILTAYMLKRSGIDCILCEAERICGGNTKNTTAKITVQHGLIYDKLIKTVGLDGARKYLEAQTKAGLEYERLSAVIDCDYEKKDSYVYSLNDPRAIESELRALQRLGANASLTDTPALPIQTAGAVCLKGQAQFNPLKLLYALAKDLPIYENTKIKEIKLGRARFERGEIRFDKLVIATHFPILNKHGLYFLKMYQHRSYVIALKGTDGVGGMYVDECDKGMSFRDYGDLLLLGGGSHRTGKKGGSYQELENFAKEHYPSAEIFTRWAAQDCMTLDGIPYIGQYSKNTPNVLVATGFNKWGMTSSMAAAMILTDLVRGKANEYSDIFSPSRSILHPQLAVNAFESMVGLLTPTAPRCPHLGCALKYNKAEHTWDCPCHGSRFTEEGQLIDNPATDDNKNM